MLFGSSAWPIRYNSWRQGVKRKVKIVLIEPSDPWVTNNKDLMHYEQVMPPIGLMYLSSFLKERLNILVEIKIISTIIDLERIDDLRRVLKEFSPDIVGIRSVLFYIDKVNQVSIMTKKVLTNSLIIVGGPAVSLHNIERYSDKIEIFVEGEGEYTLFEIVDRFLKYGKDGLFNRLGSISGILYRRNGKLNSTKKRGVQTELDLLPFPDYSSVDLEKYRNFFNYGYNRRRMGVLFTSRGCPYRCIYCHNIFGKKVRYRSARSVYDEIVLLHTDFDIEDFCIIDDNFALDTERVEELTAMLIKRGPKVKLYFPNGLRADALSVELIDRLQAAGALYITFSLETASERLQKVIKKHMNIKKLEQIVNYSCEKQIITNLCLMVGFPTETLEEARYSLDYFSRFKKIVIPYYFSVKYYPGTELYMLAKEHRIEIDETAFMHPYHGVSFQKTPLISDRDFERLYQWYLRNVFLDAERLQNSVAILSKHFTRDETNDMFSLFFRRKISDVQTDVLQPVHEYANT